MNPYVPLLMLFVFAAVLTGTFLFLSHIFSPKKKRPNSPEKQMSYECGLNSVGQAHDRISIKFYLVAMLFILFDVEVVFLYPWAVLFKEFVAAGMGPFILGEMLVFMVVLIVGLIYVYGRKALEWE